MQCIEKASISKLNCSFKPYTIENDLLRKYCNEEKLEMKEIKYCKEMCHLSCEQEYFTFKVDNKNSEKYFQHYNTTDNIILLKKQNDQENYYTAEAKYEFIQFFTDLGSLFGLYVGVAIIDLNEFIKITMIKFKEFLELFLSLNILYSIKTRVLKVSKIIIKFLKFMSKVEWKKIMKLISIPVMLYQICFLLYDYSLYSTLIKYEFPEYVKQDRGYLLKGLIEQPSHIKP